MVINSQACQYNNRTKLMGVTYKYLTGFKAKFMRQNLSQTLLEQSKTWDKNGKGARRKLDATVLIKEYNNTVTPNNTLLYSQINVLLNNYQRIFLLQQMETNIESHSQTVCRKPESLEHSVLNSVSSSISSCWDLSNSAEVKVERL